MKKVTKKQRLFSKNFTTHSLIATKSIYYNEQLPYQKQFSSFTWLKRKCFRKGEKTKGNTISPLKDR